MNRFIEREKKLSIPLYLLGKNKDQQRQKLNALSDFICNKLADYSGNGIERIEITFDDHTIQEDFAADTPTLQIGRYGLMFRTRSQNISLGDNSPGLIRKVGVKDLVFGPMDFHRRTEDENFITHDICLKMPKSYSDDSLSYTNKRLCDIVGKKINPKFCETIASVIIYQAWDELDGGARKSIFSMPQYVTLKTVLQKQQITEIENLRNDVAVRHNRFRVAHTDPKDILCNYNLYPCTRLLPLEELHFQSVEYIGKVKTHRRFVVLKVISDFTEPVTFEKAFDLGTATAFGAGVQRFTETELESKNASLPLQERVVERMGVLTYKLTTRFFEVDHLPPSLSKISRIYEELGLRPEDIKRPLEPANYSRTIPMLSS